MAPSTTSESTIATDSATEGDPTRDGPPRKKANGTSAKRSSGNGSSKPSRTNKTNGTSQASRGGTRRATTTRTNTKGAASNGASATNGKTATNGARNGKTAAAKRRAEQRPQRADAGSRAKLASLPPPPDPPASHVEAVPTEVEPEPELSPARPELRLTEAPPTTPAPRRGRRRTLARRRTDVVRRISTWSMLKVSLLFWLAMWIVLLIAGAILWRVGESAGLVTNAESFWAEATGQESVSWDGQALLRTAGMAGAVLAFAATALTVLCTMLFNVICDLTGGIRVSALELVGKAERPASEAGASAPAAEEPEPVQAEATEWPASRRAG